MEVERHEEKVKADDHKQYTWLMIREFDSLNDIERHIFYNIADGRYYVRFIPDLKNKYVACCYGGWLVLCDLSTDDCSILNILTMEKFELPPFPSQFILARCVMSSSKMDRSCQVILFDKYSYPRFYSCYIGDSEVIEGTFTSQDGFIGDVINFKGKFYALITHQDGNIGDFNLYSSDFSDPGLRLELVISGESETSDSIFTYSENIHLVESCEDLLLIYMSHDDFEFSDVRIFKADFSIGKWVKLETLGDRVIFLGSLNTSFSSPASAFGMKSNVVYWASFRSKYLYMYDIEDKSISISLPVPIEETYVYTSWASFPIICNEEKKLEWKDMSFLVEVSPNETNFHVQQGKATTELQIEQRKPKKREETKTIGKTSIVRKESLWEDFPNDLLLEIFQYLFGGDRVAFRSVCRSWYSILPSTWPSKKIVLPLKHSDCSPLLMCPGNKICHPIFGDLYSIDFLDVPGSKVRAARDGWLLMENSLNELFFYNPITKEEIELPDCDPDREALFHSVFFSAPPISPDCLVIVAADLGYTSALYYMKIEDEDWTSCNLSQWESFYFSKCNAVPFKDQYYFLGDGAKLLIFCPKKFEARVIEAPKFISSIRFDERGQQYMLESDGKLITVFVSIDGSSVYTCEWNESTSEWEIIVSLENIMLFVSRPLSICKRATVRGTGNKIYFPRVVGDGHILFYSLATKRYHTFEMGSSYSNFLDSKFYPQYNSWFMP